MFRTTFERALSSDHWWRKRLWASNCNQICGRGGDEDRRGRYPAEQGRRGRR